MHVSLFVHEITEKMIALQRRVLLHRVTVTTLPVFLHFAVINIVFVAYLQHHCVYVHLLFQEKKHLQYIYTYIHILLKSGNLNSMYFLNSHPYSSEYYLNI